MTKDLEETLAELGPEYSQMVFRMKDAFAEKEVVKPSFWKRPSLLAAASLIALIGGICVFVSSLFSRPISSEGAVAQKIEKRKLTAFMLAEEKSHEAIDEIIRTQNPDGSWQTDFLTRRNADALLASTSPEAKLAYRKALRNLRARGLL